MQDATVIIRQRSTGMMEIDISIDWVRLGKEIAMRYAEGIAKAVTLDETWRATGVHRNDDEEWAMIRLVKGRPS